jgi:hypothetical protein
MVGVIVYVGLVLLLRIVPREDLALFWSLTQGALARLRPRPVEAAGGGEP